MSHIFFSSSWMIDHSTQIYSDRGNKHTHARTKISIPHGHRMGILCNCDWLAFLPWPECEQYYFLLEGMCVGDCPDGSFASEHLDECIHCHSDCSLCDGPAFDDCTVCRHHSAVRYNGECLPKCPISTYYDSNTNECRGRGQFN